MEQVKYEAQQAEAKAKGEAAAILEKAKSEAEAIKIKAESVTTPVLFLEAINQWDGKLPTHLLGSPALPVANLTETPVQNVQ